MHKFPNRGADEAPAQRFTVEDMGIYYEAEKKPSILTLSRVKNSLFIFAGCIIVISLGIIFWQVKKSELQQGKPVTLEVNNLDCDVLLAKFLKMDKKIAAAQDALLTKFLKTEESTSAKFRQIDKKISIAIKNSQDELSTKLFHMDQKITAVADAQGVWEKLNGLQTLKDPPLKDWTIFQYHNFSSGTTLFNEGNWQEYREGFGSFECITSNAFWLGLEQLRNLTSVGKWKLLIAVKYDKLVNKLLDVRRGTWGWGIWEEFSIESDRYQLKVGNRVKMVNMGRRDPFVVHNNEYFSTRDHDNGASCAKRYRAGWWYGYKTCYHSCLNCDLNSERGVVWYDISAGCRTDDYGVLVESLMAISRV